MSKEIKIERLKEVFSNFARLPVLIGILAVCLAAVAVVRFQFSRPILALAPAIQVPAIKPWQQAPPVKIEKKSELTVQARKAFGGGLLRHSLSLYRQALEKDPNNTELLNNVGFVLFELGKLKEADAIYSQIAASVSNCSECFNNWGQVKQARGSLLEAEKLYRRAILTDSKYADPHFNLAVLYEQNGDLRNAEISYEEYIQKQHEDSKIIESIARRMEKIK